MTFDVQVLKWRELTIYKSLLFKNSKYDKQVNSDILISKANF